MPFKRLPINEQGFGARNVDENFRRVEETLGGTLREPSLETLAQVLGGAYFEGEVSSTADTAFRHALGRIPAMVVISAHLDGDQGPGVRGDPAGGGGAANVTAWTRDRIYVRATADGTYAFVVL